MGKTGLTVQCIDIKELSWFVLGVDEISAILSIQAFPWAFNCTPDFKALKWFELGCQKDLIMWLYHEKEYIIKN